MIPDVRSEFGDWTLAQLYDPRTMPATLQDAFKLNDTAVALAYVFEEFMADEVRIVVELMKLYERLTRR